MKNGGVHTWMFARETRGCEQHRGPAPINGGKWLVSNGGKNRRWICAVCAEIRRARLAETEKVEA